MKFLIKEISPSRKEVRITLNSVRILGADHYIFGSINIKLGSLSNESSSAPLGRRYFTDLRFEQVENFGVNLNNHVDKLKVKYK